MVVRRFGVYLASLEPTVGREIGKTRPCVVVSPDEVNRHLRTVIVAPMTSTRKGYPSRVPGHFAGWDGEVALDQVRTVDQSRLVRHVDALHDATGRQVLRVLREMFR